MSKTLEAPIDRSTGAPLLVVEDLTVRFHGKERTVTAVDGVSFSVQPGERVAIVGESGSGKSTLGLAIGGFLSDADTEVSTSALSLNGRSIVNGGATGIPQSTAGLSMMFQDAMTSLDAVWTIGSQMKAVLTRGNKLSKVELREQSEYWLGRVGLHDFSRVLSARPYELSGGMRQRVMLALAICRQPSLLVADEPTSALDATLARTGMELMVELADSSGAALLVISHDIQLCQEFSDTTIVMHRGRMVDKVASSRLGIDATDSYTKGLMECIPTLADWNRDELPTFATLGEVA
ncbi:MAG: peptide transporter ATP-binding protein [Microbacteriaceae bacterium]|nr:peptide transporter ATP-binding protein [Microbacteriaceae bacterium]